MYKYTSRYSIGEFDAGNVQCHSEIDAPPGICFWLRVHARSIVEEHAVVAVISEIRCEINAGLDALKSARLKRRTLQSNVDIETSIHQH